MPRPEWLACIAQTHNDFIGKSWCGRDIQMEFYFASIDHAAYNAKADDRLVACKGCVLAIWDSFRPIEKGMS